MFDVIILGRHSYNLMDQLLYLTLHIFVARNLTKDGINETDLDTLHFSHERGVWLMNNRQVVLSLSIPLEKILFAPPQCNAIVGRCLPQYNGEWSLVTFQMMLKWPRY